MINCKKAKKVRKVEKEETGIRRLQFIGRLNGTILRVNWLLAVIALLPLLYKLLTGIVAFGSAIYLMFLLIFVIASLGVLLLNEGFRSLFHTDSLDKVNEFAEQITNFYRVMLPIIFVVSLALFALNLFLSICYADGRSAKGRILSESICLGVMVLALVLFYAWMQQGVTL